MPTTRIPVSEFKARCTAILRGLDARPRRIEVTRRGRVIAVVSAPEAAGTPRPSAWLGSLRGSVLRYDAPCAPAADPEDWDALRS